MTESSEPVLLFIVTAVYDNTCLIALMSALKNIMKNELCKFGTQIVSYFQKILNRGFIYIQCSVQILTAQLSGFRKMYALV